MPKLSLLSDDDRDQLLKELAFGFSIQDLSKKYNLKPVQIEYQRGNNSQLYNMYLDFFCIKEEIWDWEFIDLHRFVLNLLYPKVKKISASYYLYKNNKYTMLELYPFAEKILEREGLPSLYSDKIKIRYTNKKTYGQSLNVYNKTNLNVINKMKFLEKTKKKSIIKKNNKYKLIEVLCPKIKFINWKVQLNYNNEEELYQAKVFYRLLTEKDNEEISNILHILLLNKCLNNSLFNIVIKDDLSYEIILKDSVNSKTLFCFFDISCVEKIENFINSYCLGLNKKFLPLFYNLALKSNKTLLNKIGRNLKNELKKYCEYIDEEVLTDDLIQDIKLEQIHYFIKDIEKNDRANRH